MDDFRLFAVAVPRQKQASFPVLGRGSENAHARCRTANTLPRTCWLDNDYRPLQARLERLLEWHVRAPAAQAVVAEHQAEVGLYGRSADLVSYGFYVARKLA